MSNFPSVYDYIYTGITMGTPHEFLRSSCAKYRYHSRWHKRVQKYFEVFRHHLPSRRLFLHTFERILEISVSVHFIRSRRQAKHTSHSRSGYFTAPSPYSLRQTFTLHFPSASFFTDRDGKLSATSESTGTPPQSYFLYKPVELNPYSIF